MPWIVAADVCGGMSESISNLMWADGRGGTMAILDNMYYIVNVALICLVILGSPEVTGITYVSLYHIGLVEVAGSLFYNMSIYVTVSRCFGCCCCFTDSNTWISPFAKGLFRNYSLRNSKLVSTMLSMSVSLTVGNLLSQSEWQILTILAAYMGAPEVATWTIMGSIWEIFEYLPTAVNTACEIRVSRHLGKGNPGMAKIAAYKSMFYSTILVSFATAVFVYYRKQIIGLYTEIEFIQETLDSLVMQLGIANILMVIGISAFTILCTQSRIHLATMCYVICSLALTIPLAIYFVYIVGYGLQSILFSMIVGYSVSAMLLLLFVFTANWRHYSDAIIEENEVAIAESERISSERYYNTY